MNRKNIAKHLRNKIDDFCESIKDENLVELIKKDIIVTGGALVSLLKSEDAHDYDFYFKKQSTCWAILDYYIKVYNDKESGKISFTFDEEKERFFVYDDSGRESVKAIGFSGRYHLKYISNNAISLSDKTQLIVRFWGNVDEIHKNYDFVHCTCSYDYHEDIVNLPSEALESIINKELVYRGSKYPLCSIIRTRKFIARGYHINAGQYLKMCAQLNDLDLKNIEVLQDQLIGVDSAYFNTLICQLNTGGDVTTGRVIELVDKIF